MKNSVKFWDNKIKSNRTTLFQSPIYKMKNKIVVSEISKLKGNLLDLGFGYGYLEQKVIDKNLNLVLFGIDISHEAVKRANVNFKGTFIQQKLGSKLPFKSGFFDVICALDVLEHLNSIVLRRVMDEIFRVMNKQAKLIVSVPLNESKIDSMNNQHLQIFTEKKLASLLNASGFQITKSKYLFAYNKFFWMKTMVSKLFQIGIPNLLIVIVTKK
ncbi:MAG: class I SAM-dependent methyltransferase [bacterium]|nr:MAG: class I SAM-dependent methyltransferase [bacterium]